MSHSQGTEVRGGCLLPASLGKHPSKTRAIPHLPKVLNPEPEPPLSLMLWSSPGTSSPTSSWTHFATSLGTARKIPASKMQKIYRNTGASYLLLFSVARVRVFRWELLFHPSGSIEKHNCTMRFWGLKGSWSIHQRHRCLTQKSVSSIEMSRAIRIVYFHDKPTDN